MRTSQSGQSPLLLLDVVKVIHKLDINYAVIGAMAASFYGAVRASADADAVLSITIKGMGGLEQELRKTGLKTEFRIGDPEDPIPAVLSVRDAYDNRVDLLAGIRGMDPGAFARIVETPFEGDCLRMIGLEDFIAMKLFAGGPKDLEDARNAIAVSAEALNRPLLEKLAARFGATSLKLLRTIL